jgi:hypothetical protein
MVVPFSMTDEPLSIQVSRHRSVAVPGSSMSSGRTAVTPLSKIAFGVVFLVFTPQTYFDASGPSVDDAIEADFE